jgi:hypothetical protein
MSARCGQDAGAMPNAMQPRRPNVIVLALFIAVAALSGCVTSESSRYEDKLSARVHSTPAAPESCDVATAFRLDSSDQPPLAVAGAPADALMPGH